MAAAERRLAVFAEQWRPASPLLDPLVEDPWPVPAPGANRRLHIVTWSPAATRALIVLVVAALGMSAYWVWSGRPRAVAQVPSIVATGITVAEPASVPAVPASAADIIPVVPADTSPPDTQPPPTSEVVVHVVGLVVSPGLVRLPLGSRVADAVAAAGGVTRRRAADSVNLARVLVDGEQVVVGGATPISPAATGAAASAAGAPVDLNLATEVMLDGLPGVGPVLAGRIIAWRAANGSFRSIDELGEVSGIGDAILAQLRPLVRV